MTTVSGAAVEFYPAVLKLDGRTCLVAGGGPVALRKAADLLRCGARVHAVAPAWHSEDGWEQLERDAASRRGQASLRRSTRAFRPSDLDGVAVAVAATGERCVQEDLARLARARDVLLNVVDVPDLCTFFVPATLRRGSLIVSVSTEGRCPSLAVALRDRLARELPEGVGSEVERFARARDVLRGRSPDDPGARALALRGLVTPEAVDDLVAGRRRELEEHVERWIASL